MNTGLDATRTLVTTATQNRIFEFVISDLLDKVREPVFAIRGTLPWGSLLNAYWDLDELKGKRT